ncbi:MAG: chromosomal replication initiator protein DnaA [Treponemataceae bacterium]
MLNEDDKKVWDKALEKLYDSVTDFEKNTILSNIGFVSLEDKILTISATSNLTKTSFETKLYEKTVKVLSELLNKDITIEIEVAKKNNSKKSAKKQTNSAKPVSKESKPSKDKSLEAKKMQQLENIKKRRAENPKINTEYTFDNFVISENNAFAANAAKAITQNLGDTYNPFLIYGGVGLGKTHLMEAIGNEVIEKTNLKVIYIPTEDFMNEFIHALSGGSGGMQAFKKKYRYTDVLLLDDIQFFDKKEQLQNEFFYTFNHLYDTKKQMVFTCDRPPNTLQNLADRLKSRFEQGLTVDLKPPLFETRCAILRKKLQVQNRSLPNEFIELVARNISSNVRDLNAALIKLLAYEDMTKTSLTLEKVAELLKDSFSDKKQKNVSLDKILKTVADYFEISVSDIRGKSRKQNIVTARHFAMYLAKEMTQMSSTEIGGEIGNRTHGTVLHGCTKIEENTLTDPSVQTTLEQLTNNLQNLLD